jgi:hypothetical protein
MRLTIEVFNWVWQFDLSPVIHVAEPEKPAEFREAPPHDPHGTLSCQVEQGSGADAFTSDVAARRTGFSQP